MATKVTPRPLTTEEAAYVEGILREHDATLRRVIYSVLGKELRDEGEDVLQNVYEAVCRQVNDFKACDNHQALLVTIAARSAWRTRKKLCKRATVPLTEDIPMSGPDHGLLEILPFSTSDEDRRLLAQIYEEGNTIADEAEARKIKAPTLRQRLKRIRDQLRDILQE